MREQFRGYLRIIWAVGALIILGLLAFLFFSSTVVAGGQFTEGSSRKNKYFTTIQIQKGDTLWSIAQNNITPEYESIQEYMNEVKRSNCLEDDTITAGCYLLIPYYDDEPRSVTEEIISIDLSYEESQYNREH